jgi:hypothetical protein
LLWWATRASSVPMRQMSALRRDVVFMSEIGTNRTNRAGLSMSVDRGRTEVIDARSERRE